MLTFDGIFLSDRFFLSEGYVFSPDDVNRTSLAVQAAIRCV